MDLVKSLIIAASGMRAQGERIRVVAENLANSNSLGLNPDEDPYRRKTISFKNSLDRELGVNLVEVARIQPDKSGFGTKFDPSHPAANEDGYVKTPNVNSLVEAMDIKEAQRSYEANLAVIENARAMLMRTVELLRN
ncbi:MAG: flagellar basal body rod protein FlgC [Minwuiales bacterium]|nr:flagellar basal body rod protein FlgC [Minwuiales bacterium]